MKGFEMKLIKSIVLISLLCFAGTAQSQPCTITQIQTKADWQAANPRVEFQGSATTRNMIVLNCEKNAQRVIVDIPDDSFGVYDREFVRLYISAEAAHRIAKAAQFERFNAAFVAVEGLDIGGDPNAPVAVFLKPHVFIQWYQGVESLELQRDLYESVTGCVFPPWGTGSRKCRS